MNHEGGIKSRRRFVGQIPDRGEALTVDQPFNPPQRLHDRSGPVRSHNDSRTIEDRPAPRPGLTKQRSEDHPACMIRVPCRDVPDEAQWRGPARSGCNSDKGDV
jgi:hypothetical protein